MKLLVDDSSWRVERFYKVSWTDEQKDNSISQPKFAIKSLTKSLNELISNFLEKKLFKNKKEKKPWKKLDFLGEANWSLREHFGHCSKLFEMTLMKLKLEYNAR